MGIVRRDHVGRNGPGARHRKGKGKGSFPMKKTLAVLVLSSAMAGSAAAADAVGKILDVPIRSAESEIVSLVEAMPADRFEFAPTQGEFKGVRTFALQARHIAAVIYAVTAAANGEKSPVEAGKNENGPDTLRTKDQIVKFMKDAFADAPK